MTTATSTAARIRVRVAVAAVLGLAAIVASLLSTSVGPEISASPNCLAWVGSRDDGQCIGYSNGTPTYIGTPNFGVWGPGYGSGLGITSGPLMPGTTINKGIGN